MNTCIGYDTTKRPDGLFNWQVTAFESHDPRGTLRVLAGGTVANRSRATYRAKKWTGWARRKVRAGGTV